MVGKGSDLHLARDFRPALPVRKHLGHYCIQVHWHARFGLRGDSRQRQQIVDQVAHASGGVLHAFQVIEAILTQLHCALVAQAVAERRDFRNGSCRSCDTP